MGFFDRMILGAGDKTMVAAAFGQARPAMQAFNMPSALQADYLAWSSNSSRLVAGRIGNIEGKLSHLWHGNLTDRGYQSRHVHLQNFGFDPSTDLCAPEGFAWRWNSAKPAFHRAVADYFVQRREDG